MTWLQLTLPTTSHKHPSCTATLRLIVINTGYNLCFYSRVSFNPLVIQHNAGKVTQFLTKAVNWKIAISGPLHFITTLIQTITD